MSDRITAPRPTRPGSLLIGFWTLVIAGWNGPEPAQDAADPEPARVIPPRVVIVEGNLDRWIFGDHGHAAAFQRLEDELTLRLNDLERTCGLSPAQRGKLILAGHREVEQFRTRFAAIRESYERLKYDENNIAVLASEARPLADTLAVGLFGDRSFYAKTVDATLTPDQRGHRHEVLAERRRFRHRAEVEQAVVGLELAVGLAAGQAERFTVAIIAATEPAEHPAGPLAAKLTLYQIAKIPASQLRPIFDDDQWRSLRRRLDFALSYEPALRAAGLLDASGSGHPTDQN